MAGSLVAVFGGLLAFLEGKLDLRSVRGAPQAKGDVIRYHSERTDELERDNEQQKIEIGEHKREIDQLKQTIGLLARITTTDSSVAHSDLDLHGQLRRQLELLTSTWTTPDSNAILTIAAQSSLHQHSAAPQNNSRPHEDGSLPSRNWSTDEGWVANPLGLATAPTMVELTQVVVPTGRALNSNETLGDASAYPPRDSSANSSESKLMDAQDTSMIDITVHDRHVHVRPVARANNNRDAPVHAQLSARRRSALAEEVGANNSVAAPTPAAATEPVSNQHQDRAIASQSQSAGVVSSDVMFAQRLAPPLAQKSAISLHAQAVVSSQAPPPPRPPPRRPPPPLSRKATTVGSPTAPPQ